MIFSSLGRPIADAIGPTARIWPLDLGFCGHRSGVISPGIMKPLTLQLLTLSLEHDKKLHLHFRKSNRARPASLYRSGVLDGLPSRVAQIRAGRPPRRCSRLACGPWSTAETSCLEVQSGEGRVPLGSVNCLFGRVSGARTVSGLVTAGRKLVCYLRWSFLDGLVGFVSTWDVDGILGVGRYGRVRPSWR